MDAGSPCPEDGDFFDARPDAEDTEEAINKFLEGLESQEEAGFDRLHSLLKSLPVPVAAHVHTYHIHVHIVHTHCIYIDQVCIYLILSELSALLCAGHHNGYPSLSLLH
jgi:hypothetical protein